MTHTSEDIKAVIAGLDEVLSELGRILSIPGYNRVADAKLALERLSAENARLVEEIERLRRRNNDNRVKAKRLGHDMLREEADSVSEYFTPTWEPLRDIANRAGVQSAAWLASRARDLQARGIVESMWFGKFGTNFKVWRLKGRRVPVHASGGGQFHDHSPAALKDQSNV